MRLLRGVELVAGGSHGRLIVSEQPRSRPYAPVARAWAAVRGAPRRSCAVGPIRNTRDEAVAVARLCREHGWRRVLAVTSPVHTRRAGAALEQAGLEVVSVPSIETRYDLETLDRPGDAAARLRLDHARAGRAARVRPARLAERLELQPAVPTGPRLYLPVKVVRSAVVPQLIFSVAAWRPSRSARS